MFMDVSLPVEDLTHPDITTASSSGDSVQQRQNENSTATSAASTAAGSSNHTITTINSITEEYKTPKSLTSTLTVALFHTPEVGMNKKIYPDKKGGLLSGDSDDQFLGMASVDLTRLFTGRDTIFDRWIPLSGGGTSSMDCHHTSMTTHRATPSSVRIVCEYEASDPPPSHGDICRFTTYCHPKDLYPLEPGLKYRVVERNGDTIILSYATMEGWDCTFQAHRFMLICVEERNANVVETAQDELASVAARLVHSPLLKSVTQTAEKVAVDGLLTVGEELAHGGVSLLNRWFSGGVDTVLGDISNATNWDGRYNPDNADRLDLPDLTTTTAAGTISSDSSTYEGTTTTTAHKGSMKKVSSLSEFSDTQQHDQLVALPNMPACPITGEPMVDPVVAADGKFLRLQYSLHLGWRRLATRTASLG